MKRGAGAGNRESGIGKRRARTFLRITIGAILLATAVGKLADIRGFAEILRGYGGLSEPALLPAAVAVPLAELALALWLLSGRALFSAAVAATAMHVAYAGWSAAALFRGVRLANCGCFGVFLRRPLGWSTVVEDVALSGASLTLALLSRKAA